MVSTELFTLTGLIKMRSPDEKRTSWKLEVDKCYHFTPQELIDQSEPLGYPLEELIATFLTSSGYKVTNWDDPYDKLSLSVPKWARKSDEVITFLTNNKWFDILVGKDGSLTLVEVKSTRVETRRDTQSRYIFKFKFGKPPDYYTPPYDSATCWEGGRARLAKELGIQFMVAVCWVNLSSSRFYCRIFDEYEFTFTNTSFTVLPLRKNPENKETRKKILEAILARFPVT